MGNEINCCGPCRHEKLDEVENVTIEIPKIEKKKTKLQAIPLDTQSEISRNDPYRNSLASADLRKSEIKSIKNLGDELLEFENGEYIG